MNSCWLRRPPPTTLLRYLAAPPATTDTFHTQRHLTAISRQVEPPAWLVHFTDQPELATTGLHGTSDMHRLALTKNFGRKTGPGYNFAYPALSAEAQFHADEAETDDTHAYGEAAILFRAPHILVHHQGDDETQAIFLGNAMRDVMTLHRTVNWQVLRNRWEDDDETGSLFTWAAKGLQGSYEDVVEQLIHRGTASP